MGEENPKGFFLIFSIENPIMGSMEKQEVRYAVEVEYEDGRWGQEVKTYLIKKEAEIRADTVRRRLYAKSSRVVCVTTGNRKK